MQKFVNELKLLKVKIGLSPELIRDIFEFMEQQSSLRMNSQFRPREPNSGKGYHLACER